VKKEEFNRNTKLCNRRKEMKRCIIGWNKTDWLGCSKIVSYTYTSHNPLQPICLICFLIISSPFILEDKDGTWFPLRSYFLCLCDLSNISSLTFFFLMCHFVFFRYTVAFQGYSTDIKDSIIFAYILCVYIYIYIYIYIALRISINYFSTLVVVNAILQR